MAEIAVRTPNVGGVELKAGEHLHYFLRALGAEPVFNLACKHRTVRKETSFPDHPKMNYEWTLSREELDADVEDYTVTMSYFIALQYTLRIEHHRANHSLIETAVDKDYAGSANDDFDAEILGVERGQ
jgi:hypothetical protein